MKAIAKCMKCQKDIEIDVEKSTKAIAKCPDDRCKTETKVKIVMLSDYAKHNHEEKK